MVADLEQVCRNHVLKAFGDMDRRTFQDLNADGVVQGYARFILPIPWRAAPKLKDQLDASAFAVALQRGEPTTGPIRDFHWDCWPWIERPLEAVRQSTRKVTAMTAVMSLSIVVVS